MATLVSSPRIQLLDGNGNPYANARLYTYATGTTTPVATYANSALNIANSNPLIADTNGFFGPIFVDPSLGALKFRFFSYDDIAGEVNLGIDTDPAYSPTDALTAGEVGLALYPQTPAELLAGVAISDYSYRNEPERYGAVGDGTTDDTTALQAWASVNELRGLSGKTYKANDRITMALNAPIEGKGSSVSILDFSGANGTFSGNRCLDFSAGSLTAIADLDSDVVAGATELPITAHGLQEGQIFRLLGASWNGALSTFTKGEYCQVLEVVDADTVRLTKPLDDSYTAASTDVARFNYAGCTLRGFTVLGVSVDSPVLGMYVENCAFIRITDVQVRDSALQAATFRHCYDVETHAFVAEQGYEATEGGTQQYGVSWIHCQNVRGQGSFQGERHAWTTGSTTGGGVVNRHVVVHDSHLRSSIDCAYDNHGNSEYCGFDNCIINGAAALGGDKGFGRNSSIIGHVDIQQGQVIRFREMLGFNFELSNLYGHTLADPSVAAGAGLTGVIDLGRDGSALSANTTRGGTLSITNVRIDAPNSLMGARFINNGATSICNIVINGLDLQINAATASASGLLRLDATTGDNFQSISIRSLTGTEGLVRSKINFDVDTIIWEEETGNFIPDLAYNGVASGGTWTTQLGRYQVTGNEVLFEINLVSTAKGNAGGAALAAHAVTVTGLPASLLAIAGYAPNVCVQPAGGITFATQMGGVVSGTTIALQETDGATGALTVIRYDDLSAALTLRITGHFRRAW